MPYQDPYSALSQGLMQGLQTGMQMRLMQQQMKEREETQKWHKWQQTLSVLDAGLKTAKTLPPFKRGEYLQQLFEHVGEQNPVVRMIAPAVSKADPDTIDNLTTKIRSIRTKLHKGEDIFPDVIALQYQYGDYIPNEAIKLLYKEMGKNTEPYKPGQLIKGVPVGNKLVTLRYLGKGRFEPFATGPRYKPGVSITNVMPGLTKKTQSDLQAKIIQAQETLDKLAEAEKLFKDEYLEYAGKGKAWLADKASKLGLGWQKKFLSDYSKWKATVDQQTLLWRKFITGVAGGEKEMKEIEKTVINTKYDSPAQFKAKLEQMREMAKAAANRARYFLENFNIDLRMLPQKEKAKLLNQYPLEQFKEQSMESKPVGQPEALQPAKTDQYEVGAIYEDANGNKAKYLGDGKWQMLSK